MQGQDVTVDLRELMGDDIGIMMIGDECVSCRSTRSVFGVRNRSHLDKTLGKCTDIFLRYEPSGIGYDMHGESA